MDELFQRLSIGQAAEDSHLLGAVGGELVGPALQALLHEAAALWVVDVTDFNADKAAIRLGQARQQLTQAQLRAGHKAKQPIGRHRAIQVRLAKPVSGQSQLGMRRRPSQIQRVQLRPQVAIASIRGNQPGYFVTKFKVPDWCRRRGSNRCGRSGQRRDATTAQKCPEAGLYCGRVALVLFINFVEVTEICAQKRDEL